MRLALLLLGLAFALGTVGAAQAATDGALDFDAENTFTIPMRQDMPAKHLWPELVGQSAEAAKAALVRELPVNSLVLLVPENSMMTMDFRSNRVRVIYSKTTGLVVSPPRIG